MLNLDDKLISGQRRRTQGCQVSVEIPAQWLPKLAQLAVSSRSAVNTATNYQQQCTPVKRLKLGTPSLTWHSGSQYHVAVEKLPSIEVKGLPTAFTLTCDLQFQSPPSHSSDPHTCKRSRLEVVRFENRKIQWKWTDGRA